jgi:hypothetical protein
MLGTARLKTSFSTGAVVILTNFSFLSGLDFSCGMGSVYHFVATHGIVKSLTDRPF